MYQSRDWWVSRLICGLRTLIACTIVASATLYSPSTIHPFPTYPSLSYVIVILVVPQSTFGEVLGSFWHIIYATAQVMPGAILSLKVLRPGEISYAKAGAAIGLYSFIVGLPKSSTLLTKRVAFIEIVIVYAGAIIHGKTTGVVMHPVHVACSALLGAVACVVALLLPFPMLACSEVKMECSLYAENASKRLNLLVKAFCAEKEQVTADLLMLISSAVRAGSKHIKCIELRKEGMSWERSLSRFIKPITVNPSNSLQNIDIPLRGMEMALKWTKSPKLIDQGVIDIIKNMESNINLRLQKVMLLMPFAAATAQETKVEPPQESLLSLATISPNVKNLNVFFFLFCMRLLRDDIRVYCNLKDLRGNSQKLDEGENAVNHEDGISGVCKRTLLATAASLDLIFALKCSISLGLAVFLGLHYAKDSAFWSGLTIAISFVTTRQSAFNVANARTQGTALGSVYGVLGCYVVQNYEKYRFVILLPWIIFISFLRRSRMFGEAWGISAAIGGLLILGRNNYHQPPNIFAITRITEAVIGLSCFILVELLLQPKRASTLAKIQITNCLQSFHDCVKEINLRPFERPVSSFPAIGLIRAKLDILKLHVEELERLIMEADVEPNFWFLPFSSCTYQKLLNSLANTVDLLSFIACILETLLRILQKLDTSLWMEFQILVDEDLKLFSNKLYSSVTVLENVMSIKSIAALEKAMTRKSVQTDIESGKSVKYDFTLLIDDKEEMNRILSSLIGRSTKSTTAREIQSAEGDHQKIQNQTNLCLGSLGFCISSLMQEVSAIQTEIKELVRWENPSEIIDLHEISNKVTSLKKSTKVSYMSSTEHITSISIDRPFLGSIIQ